MEHGARDKPRRPPPRTVLERLASQRVILVTGKGGVGKSTVAATLGTILAAAGRRVHLIELDPRESLYRYFGVDPSGGDIVMAGPSITLQNLDPRHVVDGLVREFLPFDFLVRRVLASPVYRHFSEGAPGLKESVALGHAVRCVEAKHWPLRKTVPTPDVVVLDAPASGHAVSMIEAPPLLRGAVREGPIGRLLAELADVLADPARFGVIAVSLAEEMPVDETLELVTSLDHRGHRPEAIVVNGMYPPLPRGFRRRGDDVAGSLWADRRRLNERQRARLAAGWRGPIADLPLVTATEGAGLVGALAPRLRTALEVPATERRP